MVILEDVIVKIKAFLSDSYCEKGGIIGIKEGAIAEFYFDENAICFEKLYIPNITSLDCIINGQWEEEKLEFAGFVHSHPNNSIISEDDVIYIKSILKCNDILSLYCGIYDVSSDFLQWYIVDELRCLKANAIVIKG